MKNIIRVTQAVSFSIMISPVIYFVIEDSPRLAGWVILAIASGIILTMTMVNENE